MRRYLPVIALLATTQLSAADISGRWAGTLETNGNRVPIYFIFNEYDGKVGGSVSTGSRMPIYLTPSEQNTKSGVSVVTGSVPVAIEKGGIRNSEISFEVTDNAHRVMQFRLTLVNGVLDGEASVGGQVSKIAVVQIGGGSGDRLPSSVTSGFATGESSAGVGVGSGAGAGVFRVGGGVSAPVLIYKTDPEYSEAARAAKFQGTVLLYVEIGPDGAPTNIRVQRSLGLGLDEKAIECVNQWRFKPGQKDGKPVPVAATIEVNFRL